MRYEYKILEFGGTTVSSLFQTFVDVPGESQILELNRLGGERWEGFAVLPMEHGGTKVFLKREVLRGPERTVVRFVPSKEESEGANGDSD